MPTDRWGIDDEYHDALGTEHVVTDETYDAILAAMGAEGAHRAHDEGDEGPPPEAERAVRLLVPGAGPGSDRTLAGPAEIALEDGTIIAADGELPPDLPPGYHRLRMRDGAEVRPSGETLLIVSPGHCYLPEELRTWGWAAQVYAARSRTSWGLATFATWAASAAGRAAWAGAW